MNARKELITINDFLKNLTSIDEMKITYTNGFHVNTALTKTLSINIDETSAMQDFAQW